MTVSRDRRDEAWFTDIYAAHYADVVRYAVRRSVGPDASAELAQEVFETAWRRRRDVPEHSLPWLYGVARRLLANHWRARRAHPTAALLGGAAAAPATGALDADWVAVAADLRAALATLPEIDQEILRLVGWEQLSVAEAAQVLSTTRTAAKVRLHRARRRLAAAMTEPPTTAPPRPGAERAAADGASADGARPEGVRHER